MSFLTRFLLAAAFMALCGLIQPMVQPIAQLLGLGPVGLVWSQAQAQEASVGDDALGAPPELPTEGASDAATGKKKKQKVRFSQDELARESVLPVFDKTSVVKNRRVSTRGKVELGVGTGTDFLEPFYVKYGIIDAQLTYHINELHGILITATGPWFTYRKTTKSSQNLERGTVEGPPVYVSKLPRIHTFLLGNYQYTTFYSKLSLFKYATLNMMQYFIVGGGVGMLFQDFPSYKDGNRNDANKAKKYYPAAQLGAGMKFYLNPRISLRADLKMLLHQWVDLRNYSPGRCAASQDCAAKNSRWYTRSLFTVSLSGLLF